MLSRFSSVSLRLSGLSVVMVLLLSMMSGCDDDVSKGESGDLQTFPRTAINFSKVPLGESSSQELVLTNQGEADLRIFSIEWKGSDDITIEFVETTFEERVLAPREEYSILVTYAPTLDVSESGGNIEITSTDPDENTKLIDVITPANFPQIQVTPNRSEGINFGQVGRDESDSRQISITNVGELPLIIDHFTLNTTDEFSIKLPPEVELPYTIPNADTKLEIELVYAPSNLGPDAGELLIFSNDPRDEVYELPVGANSSTPCISVTPINVEFPTPVAVGDAKTRSVTIRSCGPVPLKLGKIAPSPGSSSEFFIDLPEDLEGKELAEGEEAFVDVIYAPIDEGVDVGEFTIESNDPTREVYTVPILATGTTNQCPTAEARARVQGSSVLEKNLTVLPLDILVLDGTSSADFESTIAEYNWEIRQNPNGSTSQIEQTGEPGVANFFVDIAGDYEICLSVTDAQGVESCNTDCVKIIAQPDETIHVQLVWETPEDEIVGDDRGTDVDLHFMRIDEGTWGDEGKTDNEGYDVFFLNQNPLWPVMGGTTEHPSLDRDDKDGEGPENINLDDPNACSWYAVGVHYFNDEGLGSTFATIRIYIDGLKRFQQEFIQMELGGEASGDFWQVAIVHWDGELGRVYEVPERYINGTWIGVKPTIPESVLSEVQTAAPQCFP